MSHAGVSKVSSQQLHEALDAVRDELAAVPSEKLSVVNIDLEGVVISTLGCLPEVRALRARMVGLPEFDVRYVDKLETYAYAVACAHTVYLSTQTTPASVDAAVHDLVQVRDVLDADASALVKHGVIDAQRLGELRGGNAYRSVVFDVFQLVSVLREPVSTNAAKSMLDVAYLERAEAMAQDVAKQIGLREQAPVVSSEAADTRQRAFTVFAHAYDQVRRAISYLRWDEGDADSIAPSLYAGRGGRGKKSDVQPPAPTPVAAPSTTSLVAAGLPGGDPFTSH